MTRWTFLALVFCATPRAFAEGTEDDARALYEEAARAYEAGAYPQAISAFRKAYEMKGAPGLLFNIAQSYRLWGDGHCSEALAFYHRYLDLQPNASNRDEVIERIATLKSCPVAPPPATPVAPPPPASRPMPESVQRVAPVERSAAWKILLFGGAATAGGGAAIYGLALNRFNAAKAVCPCPAGRYDGWQAATTASFVLLGAGGAAALGGGVLRMLPAGVEVAPAGAGVAVSGRF